MTIQQLTIEIELLADAMPGSGVGTELVNDLVPRDHAGQPVIPASHLKGLVRQWLIDLAAIRGYPLEPFLVGVLGHPGDSIGDDGADGQESAAIFENLRFADDGGAAAANNRFITRTALNEYGTVEKSSLRTNEALAVQSRFRGNVYLRSEPGSLQDVALRAALLSLDAIGSARNRGAGACLVRIENEKRGPGELLKALDARRHERGKSGKRRQATDVRRLSGTATWLEVVFEASSPICCPEFPTSSANNVIQSGFVIPASAVQGAVLTMLDRVNSALASACFQVEQFRCWPLQPAGMTPEEARDVFPVRVAASHRMSKLPDPETGDHEFRDSVIEPYDWRTVAKGSPLKGSDGVLLRGANGITLWRSGDMPRTWSAHGVHNGAAIAAERNLYQITAMAPMVFKGLIACPEDAAEELIAMLDGQYVTFGRSRSVRGGGILNVRRIGLLDEFFSWAVSPELDRRVFVLQSPAAVPDDHAPFGAAEERLKSLIPGEVEEHVVVNGISASGIHAGARILFGWNRHGIGRKADPRHNRLRARRVITPGSVFVLREPVRDLQQFLLKGIGDGKQQGLGVILPHPGIAQKKYSRQLDELPVIKSRNEAGRRGMKLLQRAPAVSPSQIAHLAAIAERKSPAKALEYLERQLRGRSARIWDRWKPVESELRELFQQPQLAVAAMHVWQDLAIGERIDS